MTLQDHIRKFIESDQFKEEVREDFQVLLESGKYIREEDAKKHFSVYFLPYNPKTKQVFIVHHKKSGLWLSPGGHIDSGESPLDTLKREVREEVGLEINNIKYLTNLTFIRPDNIPVFVLSMIADYLSGQIILSNELTEYAWVDLKEAKKYDFISGIYEEIKMANLHLQGKPITTWKDHKNDVQ